MAQSYRRNFIEASGGLKNVFAHKVFCGWDFSIVTEKTATLKHQTVFKELRVSFTILQQFRNRNNSSFNVRKFYVWLAGAVE